jgi:AraC family transcriptional regulator, regulatory protein of adaptative response / DNA-3-methyladenine glycosylase II
MTLANSVHYTPPYDWASLLRFFQYHLMEPVEWLEGDVYGRFFEINGEKGFFTLKNNATLGYLELTVRGVGTQCLPLLETQIKRMFDLDANPVAIEHVLKQQSPFDALCRIHAGLRMAGGWDLYETGTFAILGQLVSTAQARALARQLVESCGEPLEIEGVPHLGRLFPKPEAVLASDLAAVRTTQMRKRTLWAFAEYAAVGHLETLRSLPQSDVHRQLRALPGIGPWTADIIAMRALGNTDIYPLSDLILKRSLEMFPHLDLQQLSPYRSYATFLMWRGYAEALSKAKKHGKTTV